MEKNYRPGFRSMASTATRWTQGKLLKILGSETSRQVTRPETLQVFEL